MYLDFGQRDFTHRECAECGMIFCPGLPEDVRLHAEFHRRAVRGPRLPAGLRLTRLGEGSAAAGASCGGGVEAEVLVRGAPAGERWAREAARFAEKRVGAAPGWLQGPRAAACDLFLYASPGASREIIAVLFLERELPADSALRLEPGGTEGEGAGAAARPRRGDAAAGPAWSGVRLVWVRPDARRQGLARGLLAAALRWTRRTRQVAPHAGGVAFSAPTAAGEAWARALLRCRDFRRAALLQHAAHGAHLFTYDG